MTTVWTFPPRTLYGVGAARGLAPELRALGARSVLLVTDPGVRGAGLLEHVAGPLREAGLGVAIFDAVPAHPTESDAQAAAQAFADAGADAIVGLGGGGPLDVAKLGRLLAAGLDPSAVRSGAPLALAGEAGGRPVPPLVAVPTTAGTGSEVGSAAFVRLGRGRMAMLRGEALRPQLAVLDPELTVTMPPELTAATGFEALAHCIEGFAASGDHPVADAAALQGVRLVARWLERAVRDGEDLEARGAMLQAATLGGLALAKGAGPAHALAHPLATEYGLHHGVGAALCLPAVLDFLRGTVPAALAAVARALGVRGEDEETLAFECAGAVRALRERVGLPAGLARVGVEPDRIPKLAKLAFVDPARSGGPRECDREDLAALYRASM